MRRFYVENIGEQRSVTLSGEEAAHIAHVLRMGMGGAVTLFDGSGYDYAARITEISKGTVTLAVTGKEFAVSEPRIHITLCQAVIKNDKFEYAVQNCKEIGVARIVPFLAERCVKKPKSEENFTGRARRIALEACKQCGRSLVPEVTGVKRVDELREYFEGARVLLAYERERHTAMKEVLEENAKEENIVIIIGPEGGFTEDEAQMLSKEGAIRVSLGKLILRAETAGVAASAMVMYEYGG
jgi:16S rRNA (uracil1498-N3)-methyltransferase